MTKEPEAKPTCGIVMPISEIDGCDTTHWKNVLEILKDAAEAAGFAARLVSDSDDIGVIQANIIQSLYDSDIVLCDVSGKNANVMFELGLRLAFDKPVVVVKDDLTGYSFDTSPIEHIEYPRSLHYHKIVDFKKGLKGKLEKTCEAAKSSDHKSFLKYFGKFEVTGLSTTEVDKTEYLEHELKSIKKMLLSLSKSPQFYNDSLIKRATTQQLDSDVLKILSEMIDEHLAKDLLDLETLKNPSFEMARAMQLELSERSKNPRYVRDMPVARFKTLIKDYIEIRELI